MPYMRTFIRMRVFLLFSAFFSIPSTSIVSATFRTSHAIPSKGTISFTGYPGLELKHNTDFEDVVKVNDHTLSLSIDHNFIFGGEGGARMWIEDDFSRSGNRCLAMELNNITESRRNEFNIVNFEKLVGNELFVSVWLYLPSDWRLHIPDVDWNWYELVMIFQEYAPWHPYLCIWVCQPAITQPIFDVSVGGRDVDGTIFTLDEIKNFPLSRGKWFNVQYYLLRHQTNGVVKVWMNGILLCNRTGLVTKAREEYFTTIAKIYYDDRDTFSPYQIWVDDLEIHCPP